MKARTTIFIALWLAASSASGLRAVNCPRTAVGVYEVEQLYSTGRFSDIRDMGECVAELFEATKGSNAPGTELLSASERFFHLYALSCLALDDLAGAEMATCSLMRRFPRHSSNPELDPPQFIALSKKIVPYASNEFSVYAGANLCIPQVFDAGRTRVDISPSGSSIVGPNYRPKANADLGVSWQMHLGFQHGIVLAAGWSSLNFDARHASRAFDDEDAEEGDWRVTHWEQMDFLHIPIQYQYRLPLGRREAGHQSWLFFQGGPFLRYRLRSLSILQASFWEVKDGALSQQTFSINLSSPAQRRQNFSGGCEASIGFESDLGRLFWNVQLGARFGATQLRRVGTEYSDAFQDYIWDYHLSDQSFRLHSVHLSLGLGIPRAYVIHNTLHR